MLTFRRKISSSSLLSPVHIYERSLSSSSSSSSPFDLVVVSGIWDRAAGENALSSSIHLLKRLLAFFFILFFSALARLGSSSPICIL